MMSPQLLILDQPLDLIPCTYPILIILYQTGEKASSNNLLSFDFDTELHAKDAELPLFSYESVSAATNKFSDLNKLGEGGFGPVYKVHYIFLMNLL
jgi:hypothetical protein